MPPLAKIVSTNCCAEIPSSITTAISRCTVGNLEISLNFGIEISYSKDKSNSNK